MKKLLIALCCLTALQATAQNNSYTVDTKGNITNDHQQATAQSGNGYSIDNSKPLHKAPGVTIKQAGYGSIISGDYYPNQNLTVWIQRGDTLILKTDKIRFIKIDEQTYKIIRKTEIKPVETVTITDLPVIVKP